MPRHLQLRTMIRQTIRAWLTDYASSMGAAIAYYTAFSIAPLLLIVIAIAAARGFQANATLSGGRPEWSASHFRPPTPRIVSQSRESR